MPDHNSTAMSEEQSLLSAEIVNRGITNSGPDAGSLSFSVQVRRRLPDFLQSINLKYVKLGYHYLISHGVYLLTAPAAVLVASAQIGQMSWEGAWSSLDVEPVTFVLGLLILTVYVCFKFSPRATYLVDFTCYRPPDDYKVSKKEFIELAKKSGNFEDASLELQRRVLEKSGIGDESYLPKSIISSPSKSVTMAHTREEASLVIFGAIDNLLSVTKILPKDISVLVVNCGIFNPTPSLASMIINHYKLRSSLQSFNLGGMGCASGIIAVDLARNLLAAYPGSYALVVSTEIITATWYPGQDPAMLLPNCFFRMGSAAVLLTNKRFYRHRCKYELCELVRTQKANDDRSFRCVMQQEDQYKKKGLVVSRDILEVGGHALKDHITTLGPLVLPLSEQFNFFSNLLFRKPKSKPYIPDYKLAFEHVCILAASKTVLEEIQKNLDLTEEYMEASKMTLYRFGNTSSSSVWYQLAYSEAKGKVKKGDKVWQIAFGAGFKCNSVVWKALKDVRRNKRNIWVDGLEDYPVRL